MRLFVASSVFCLVRRARYSKSFCKKAAACAPIRESLAARKQQALGHQKTMKKAKSVIAFVFLVVLCVSVASVEYGLVMRFGVLFNLFVSVFALFVLLGALLRAPEGYEDDNGFHIGALPDHVSL
jgi:hypothetical protein